MPYKLTPEERQGNLTSFAYVLTFLILTGSLVWAAVRWYRHRNSETNPVKLRMREAVKFGWEQTAEIEADGQGAIWTRRSVRFVRGKEEAVLWHKDATVTLVRLYVPPDFEGFIELEEFIAKHPREADIDEATGERKYLQEIELFVTRHGYRDDLMHIQATDYTFLVAFGKFYKAGYAAGEDSVVVAAFLLDVVKVYDQDRERSLRWLIETTGDFNRSGCNPDAR
jgi:hypothetical protein